VNFLVTIIKMRAPGMKLMRMPMFTWTTLTANVLMVLAFPAITVVLVLVSLDRYLGMHFFTNDMGGNMMLYNNIFWMWGHPEVYIVILPAFGIFSEVVATFSKKKLFGYVSLVYATAVIMLLSFTVWLHHFFTMANTPNVNIFFGIATMMIGIPTGVKIYDWLLTMYRGRITFSPAMHWMLGFLVLFVIGGMTGVLMAVPGADYVVHNTTFLVAHFHNVLIPGALFGYLAGYNYWFPKVFGFKLNERWGKLSFWGWALGFALAFFPLYVTGFMGMPRRISHISNLSWEPFLIVAMLGTLIVGFGVFAMLVQLFFSIKDRNKNLDLTGDPWDGRTLEWSTDSPTPVYNFAVIPVVKELDDFKRMKDDGSVFHRPEKYDPIVMPKDKVYGPIMGALLIAFGFSMVWYIWWLAIISFLGILITVVVIGNDNNNEYIISAEEVKAIEDKRFEKLAAALKNKIEED
ncbi:MAG: cbb3-type cytochrome c oxidase subunit I, partial [Bacteroidota bacterium]|nr:cbb3-type cytochrome c oxidase subunit I [Bacteroidota bacterium]